MAERIRAAELTQDNPDAERMRDRAHVENEPVLAGNAAAITRERRPANYDATFVSDSWRKAMGVGEQETVVLKLNPDVHKETVNTIDNWLYEPGMEGRRVLMNPRDTSRPLKNIDCIYACCPTEQIVEQEQINAEGQSEFFDRVEYGDMPGIPRHRPRSTEELAEDLHRDHLRNVSMSLIGEFKGMAWQDVLRLKGPQWWQDQENQYRGGPVAANLRDNDAAAELDALRRDRDRRETRGRDTGGKYVSIPRNVAVKNISRKG